MKLQKYMSQSGICSRRKAEEYIAAGHVFVNDEMAHIGQVIDPETDVVRLGDQVVQDQENLVYYAYHKPRGIVTSCADSYETDIMDVVDIQQRVFPIGRLDKNSTGLLILTNDGRITHKLLHPSFEHEKEYIVDVYGKITDNALQRMKKWVDIQWWKTKPCEIHRAGTGAFRIVLTEGKNRQIRRMAEKVGHEVKRLKRIRVENIKLGKLEPGEWRPLSRKEKEELFSRIDLDNTELRN